MTFEDLGLDPSMLPPLPGEEVEEDPSEDAEGWEVIEEDADDDTAFDLNAPPDWQGGGDNGQPSAFLGRQDFQGIRPNKQPHIPQLDVPLWEQYHVKKGTGEHYQLRVQRMTDTGRRHDLGMLPPDANQRTIINIYKKHGRYLLMPINEHGKKQRTEPYIVDIPEDHPYLLQMLGKGDGGALDPNVAAAQSQLAEVLRYIREKDERDRLDRRDDRARTDTAQDRIETQRSAIHKAEAALASKAQDTVTAALTAASEVERTRSDNFLQQQQGYHASQLTLANASKEKEVAVLTSAFGNIHKMQAEMAQQDRDRRAEHWKDRDADRKDREARDREDRKDRQERERADMKDRQERRDRDDRERQTRLDREDSRNREFRTEMLKSAEQRAENSNPLSAVMASAPLLLPLLPYLGVKPEDIGETIKGLFAGNQARGWIGELADVAKEAIKASKVDASEFEDDDEDDEEMTDEEQAAQAAAQGDPAMLPAPPTYPQGEAVGGPAAMQNMPEPVRVQAPEVQVVPDMGVANFAGGIPGKTKPEGEESGNVITVPAVPAGAAGLDAKTKKVARKALRNLVEKLGSTEQVEWEKIIGANFLANAAELIPYLKAVTIRKAALDAGASADLAQQFIDVLDAKKVGLDIPRG